MKTLTEQDVEIELERVGDGCTRDIAIWAIKNRNILEGINDIEDEDLKRILFYIMHQLISKLPI